MSIEQLVGFRFTCQQCCKIQEITLTDLNAARGSLVKECKWYSLFICSPKAERPDEAVFCCKTCMIKYITEKL